ncbi:protein YhfH [Paenibacillus sp. S-38]|uniref:protein YhfH n=1 Tax=Paenibacillus sp. S-38 TaxID=3416710 RepID=UPI003CEA3A93
MQPRIQEHQPSGTLSTSKSCTQCGEVMEELFDCHISTCSSCRGYTFYDIKPSRFAPLKPPVSS